MLLILAAVAWWAIGVGGFVYWWTSDYDLEVGGLVMACLCAGWLGPLSWLIGRAIHGPSRPPRVLIKRRR